MVLNDTVGDEFKIVGITTSPPSSRSRSDWCPGTLPYSHRLGWDLEFESPLLQAGSPLGTCPAHCFGGANAGARRRSLVCACSSTRMLRPASILRQSFGCRAFRIGRCVRPNTASMMRGQRRMRSRSVMLCTARHVRSHCGTEIWQRQAIARTCCPTTRSGMLWCTGSCTAGAIRERLLSVEATSPAEALANELESRLFKGRKVMVFGQITDQLARDVVSRMAFSAAVGHPRC